MQNGHLGLGEFGVHCMACRRPCSSLVHIFRRVYSYHPFLDGDFSLITLKSSNQLWGYPHGNNGNPQVYYTEPSRSWRRYFEDTTSRKWRYWYHEGVFAFLGILYLQDDCTSILPFSKILKNIKQPPIIMVYWAIYTYLGPSMLLGGCRLCPPQQIAQL